MCAVKNTNFCKSAKEAFSLLMRNLVRVVVLDSVVDFLLFLGKLVIVLLTGVASYMAFSGQIPEIKDDIPTLNYFFTPIVFIVIGSYFIASSFFGVYAMAVDTLFLCFLEDLERNDGSMEKPYYMSKSLKKILGKMEKTVNESRYRSP
jgi:choline transporter-like protein 2/4/5